MAKTVAAPGAEILEAALLGLESQRDKLEEQISHVRSLLGRKAGRPAKSAVAHVGQVGNSGVKRILSADARKRIAAAQKKRWAAFRKNQK